MLFVAGVPASDAGYALALPQLRLEGGKGLVVHINGGGCGLLRNKRLEVDNGAYASAYGPLSKVRVFRESSSSSDVPMWEALLGSAACGAVANSKLVVVACEDATLHVLHTETGKVPFILSLHSILKY